MHVVVITTNEESLATELSCIEVSCTPIQLNSTQINSRMTAPLRMNSELTLL
jgi:hypothetical protein